MTWGLFFLLCFVLPVCIGIGLAQLINLDIEANLDEIRQHHPKAKPFTPNMHTNLMVFVLALAGVAYIILSSRVTLEKDWITPGGFLAVATINLSLGVALARRKRRDQS